ncbi:sporulation protein [Neobacillus piezotolerans]|uniref:Sporulation protein n=1 Tax=Neobacillus piezotolerans TaxID=2259171 RepID=A0A3D8GKU2_9BACI|nr:Spo0B C-terminal domain-containing protein [Neobacillus piezotolerans]RDU35063.1 sporulation protein [Neobacillus piezotolerans]
MEKNWDVVEVLRHSRHDWLNRLQLIKGNLDLNRVDRAKAIVDQIIIETQHESKLSNLKMPLFAALLLTANWGKHLFQLDYEVLHETETKPVNEGEITNWTSSFFSVLDRSLEAFQENSLSVCIDQVKDGIRFFFDFSGIITETMLLKEFLEHSGKTDVTIGSFSDTELSVEVFMPFR